MLGQFTLSQKEQRTARIRQGRGTMAVIFRVIFISIYTGFKTILRDISIQNIKCIIFAHGFLKHRN